MAELIDIDQKPWIEHEFAASVHVEDGKPRLVPTDPGRWMTTLLKLTGPISITIQRLRKRRSSEANSYYWAVVLFDTLAGLRGNAQDVGEACPFRNDDELHEAMKYRFLGLEVSRIHGKNGAFEEMERPATTTKLDTKQFSIYVDQIKAWAATKGIYVREAGEEVAI